MPDDLSDSQKKALKLIQIRREYAKQLNDLYEEVFKEVTQVRKNEEDKKLSNLRQGNLHGN
jgi:hypothetical protein